MADSLEPGWFQITLKVFMTRPGPDGTELLVLRDAEKQTGDLPGGRLAKAELYDPWLDAVRREIGEELGDEVRYELQPESLFHFAHLVENGEHPAVGFAYAARFTGGEITLSAEHDWMDWVKLDEFRPETLFRNHLLAAVKRFQQEFGAV